MTRLTWFECLVLLAFWMGGLSAYLIGGRVLVGYVVQAFLVVVLGWIGRIAYLEYIEVLRDEYYRDQIFRNWRENSRRKGME